MGEFPHVVRPRGGEERGLASGVSLSHDGADVPLKPLVQHPETWSQCLKHT